MTDGALLQSYPELNASDIAAAWDDFAANREDVEVQMRQHEETAKLARLYSNENVAMPIVNHLRACGYDGQPIILCQ